MEFASFSMRSALVGTGRRHLLIGGAMLALLAIVAAPASATMATVTISNGTTTQVIPINLSNPDPNDPGIFIGGGMSIVPGQWTMDSPFFVAAELRSDKSAIAPVMGIKNTSGSTKSFTVTFEVPVLSAIANTLTAGAAIVGGSGLGTMKTTSGSPFYMATVDGVDFNSLLPDPTILPLNSGSNQAQDDFGYPAYDYPGVPVNTKIGIRWQFDVTSGDAASFNANFFACQTIIPEPSSFALLFVAVPLAGWALRRRTS